MNTLALLLYTMLPLIIAGVLNMVWVKGTWASALQKPMDGGRKLNDGKRIFGDNKTWKGFIGMVLFTALTTGVFQAMAISFPTTQELSIVPYQNYSWPLGGFAIGILWGLAYVLAELPNSFVKRRINIPPGQSSKGIKGFTFVVIDQADSVLGCVLVMPLFSSINVLQAALMVILATAVHLLLNMLLYVVKLRKHPF